LTNLKDDKPAASRLVIFDVEGILIPKNRYLLFEMTRKLGLWGFLKTLIFGLLYETHIISLESALKRIFAMFKDLSVDETLQLHKRIPLMPGTETVFKKLKSRGYRTALISSGLPTSIVKDFAARLQADHAVGLELTVKDGQLTGEIGGDVLKSGGKAAVLKRILEQENLSPDDCVVVADDRNNLSMFPLCSLRIGYNPDFVMTAKSDIVVKGELTEILPYITGDQSRGTHTLSRGAGLRETIHVGSFSLALISALFSANVELATLILAVTVLYTVSEFCRVRGINIPVVSAITWMTANKTELYEYATAPILFALGNAFSLLFFPPPACYVAITVLTLGDGGAHIFGMKFGKTPLPFNKGKNLEGTIVGFVFAFLGAAFFVEPFYAMLAAAVGMLMESVPFPINDNLTVPLVSGGLLALLL